MCEFPAKLLIAYCYILLSISNFVHTYCISHMAMGKSQNLCCMYMEIRTEMMTMLESFCSTTILSSSTEFVIFVYTQISKSWCHNDITISSCKLELKTREYILSFIVTAHNMSYIAYNTLHVTHCMLHHNTCIDVPVSNILLFVLFRECSDRVRSSDPSSCSLC